MFQDDDIWIGLSPNGKATDSDSVIFKVRILVAQLQALSRRTRGLFFLLYSINDRHFVDQHLYMAEQIVHKN